MEVFNVLWFDDEHEKLELIKDEAVQNGIQLVAYDNSKDGIAELRENYLKYDAVIVDGLFNLEAKQKGNMVTQQAFGNVALELKQLKEKGIILPWFIFSGQASFVKDRNDLVSVLADKDFGHGRIYDKNNDEDFEDLCRDIKASSLNIKSIKLRHRYSEVFDACKDRYIGEKNVTRVMDLITFLDEEDNYDESKFNIIRKVFESVLHACSAYGFVHDACKTKGEINMTWSLLFLQGKEVAIPNPANWTVKVSGKKRMPDIISSIAFNIKEIASSGSHTENSFEKANEEGLISKSQISDLFGDTSRLYLVKSLIYQLLDLILWFKSKVDSNPDVDLNRSQWNKDIYPQLKNIGLWVKGNVTEIADNGWGTLQPSDGGKTISIPPSMVINKGLRKEDIVEYISQLSSNKQKVHIKEIKKSL